MISAVFAMLGSLFDTNTTTSRALVDEGIAFSEIVQARIATTRAQVSGDDVRTNVDLTIANSGNADYGNFDEWHISVEYLNSSGGLEIKQLPFSDLVSDNRWMLQAIYEDAATALAEVVDRDVLNPREEMAGEKQWTALKTPIAKSAATTEKWSCAPGSPADALAPTDAASSPARRPRAAPEPRLSRVSYVARSMIV